VLGDHLKAVVGRESECFNHGALQAIDRRVAIVQEGSLAMLKPLSGIIMPMWMSSVENTEGGVTNHNS
jgi:hypothetical protein